MSPSIKKYSKGFTLIELLVVIAIIALLSSAVISSLSKARSKSRDAQRVASMKAVQTALEMYFSDYSRYPTTSDAWRSECAAWGSHTPANVIPGLSPTYIGKVPSDPFMKKTTNQNCFIYRSNGVNYAFLDHNSNASGVSDIDFRSQPTFIDPVRDGGTSSCNVDGPGTGIWAWKISSQGYRCI
jgi:type II secretion system protein G